MSAEEDVVGRGWCSWHISRYKGTGVRRGKPCFRNGKFVQCKRCTGRTREQEAMRLESSVGQTGGQPSGVAFIEGF